MSSSWLAAISLARMAVWLEMPATMAMAAISVSVSTDQRRRVLPSLVTLCHNAPRTPAQETQRLTLRKRPARSEGGGTGLEGTAGPGSCQRLRSNKECRCGAKGCSSVQIS
jgi:hypothetical protein